MHKNSIQFSTCFGNNRTKKQDCDYYYKETSTGKMMKVVPCRCLFCLAERGRFELPERDKPLTRLAGEHLQPL
ncbi:MAG: hypothetical protein PHI40_06290, partial [Caldisericia bacterium]|nr:hypothetical protein [Caldisericia bacterium]